MMKRKTLLSKVMLLLCILTAGVSNAWGTSVTYKLEIALSDLTKLTSTSGYAGYNGERTTQAVCTTDATKKMDVKWTSYQVMEQSTKMQWQKNAGYIYNSTDLGTITNVTVTNTGGTFTTYYGSSSQPSSSTTVGGGFFKICVGNATGYTSKIEVTFTIEEAPAATLTGISVKTAPTKTKYKVTEKPDLTGLVLLASYDNGETMDVTSGFTADPSTSTALTTSDDKITFTWNGQTCEQPITVGELSSITYNSVEFANTTYTEQDDFNATGLVVTAHYTNSDGLDEVVDDYTLAPSTNLATTDDKVVVTYEWNEVVKTVNIPITVNEGTKYTLTFDAGAGSCATTSLTQSEYRGTITLPTATIAIDGWTFAGWALEPVANTSTRPTLYAGGQTIIPNSTRTVYAVYTLEDPEGDTYVRAKTLKDITSAKSVVIVTQGKVLDKALGSVAAPSEVSEEITVNDNIVWKLDGNNTDGYILSNTSITTSTKTIGISSMPSTSANLALSSSNNKWLFVAHEHVDYPNEFILRNTQLNSSSKVGSLEYYSGKWKVYCLSASGFADNENIALKVYVPKNAYNSNPAAMINPTVAYSDHTTPTLYLDGTNTHTRTATLTGIDKPITYASSDEDVATVSSEGVVTAVGIGTATITASVAAVLGVNKYASDTYDVVVKNTATIAGIKAITDASSAVAFAADLTDAVVTYVYDTEAYIQDATGGIYVSCGDKLTLGNKINGAVSGSVKAANEIDEITAIDLKDATVTADGVIPAAAVLTLAEIKAAGTEWDGKKVTVNGAKVTTALTDEENGDITDDNGTTSFKLVSPFNGVNADRLAEGNITGFISLYNGTTYRLNVYEQSQIVLTKNAPTAQTLTFDQDAIELDEETSAFDAFTGQTVSGAQGTVTYALTGDAIGEVNASTGAVTLNGARGTATITATAAAKEVTEAGVTTPYTETEKSYTITVRPRYTVTFSVNGEKTELREASYGAGVTVPDNPSAIGDYKFQGWSTATVAKTDTKPTLASIEAGDTYKPTDDETIYAVFANEEGSPLVEHTSTLTMAVASAPSSPYVSDGSSWTWSNATFTTTNNKACINSSNGRVTFTLPEGGKAVSLTITRTDNSWAGAASVVLKDESNNTLKTFSLGSNASATYNFTSTYDHAASYTLSNTSSKDAWVDHIDFEFTTGGTIYSNYTTSLNETVAITDAGLATYASDYALDYTTVEDIEAYIAKEEEGTVKLYQVNKVPAGTGVLLRSTNGGTEFVVPIITAAPDVIGNIFVRGTGAAVESGSGPYNYILNKIDGVLGFYKANGNMVAKNRAYLQTTASSARIALNFDDETTGIKSLTPTLSEGEGAVYDMQGRKVNAPKKGLYIINGRKVVIK